MEAGRERMWERMFVNGKQMRILGQRLLLEGEKTIWCRFRKPLSEEKEKESLQPMKTCRCGSSCFQTKVLQNLPGNRCSTCDRFLENWWWITTKIIAWKGILSFSTYLKCWRIYQIKFRDIIGISWTFTKSCSLYMAIIWISSWILSSFQCVITTVTKWDVNSRKQ